MILLFKAKYLKEDMESFIKDSGDRLQLQLRCLKYNPKMA